MTIKLIATLIVGLAAAGAGAGESAPLKTDKDKSSYALGVEIGRNFHSVGADVGVKQIERGLRDGLAGAKPALTERQIRQLLAAYRAELGQKQQKAFDLAKVENTEKGEAFRAEYIKKDGVIAAPNGILFRVLKSGTGRRPSDTDTVMVSYRGRLIDGTEFDASEPGQPARFKLNVGVIHGLSETLQQMTVGSKWEVVMPPALAYGDRGMGSDIPPAATLVFDIELLSIVELVLPRPPAAK